MLAALALALTLPSQEIRTVELVDGGTVTVPAGDETLAYRYWSCADTFLESREAEQNFGSSHILQGGPGRTVFIRFGDLNRALGGYRRVRSARLVLTTASEGAPALKSVRRVLAPWGEGPIRTMMVSASKDEKAPQGSTTWRSRRAGAEKIDWQQAGALGPADSTPIEGVDTSPSGGMIEITGITEAVQAMADRWYENHGLALVFDKPIEFYSSKAPDGRPRLILELERAPEPKGPDLSVIYIESNPSGMDPIKEGTSVTYVAHVKNLGDSAANGFTAEWIVNERSGSTTEIKRVLAPKEVTTVELKLPYRGSREDHRLNPIGLRIRPLGDDAVAGNDYLEIQAGAVPIVIQVHDQLAGALTKGRNSLGSRSVEDTVQEQFRVLNDVALSESRFSFAPEGAKERFRVQQIAIGAGPADSIAAHQLKLNEDWGHRYLAATGTGLPADLLNTLGVPNLQAMQIAPMGIDGKPGKVMLKEASRVVPRGGLDRFPGLMGGGSTLNEASLPGAIPLPYEPMWSTTYENLDLRPSGLFSATEIAWLNQRLINPEAGITLPGTILLRAMNYDGRPLADTELAFFQSAKGVIPDGPAAFTLKTGRDGSALLPNRPAGEGKPSDPFGGLQLDGGNGVFLVRAVAQGTTEWAWLKAWQIADAYSRTGRPAVVLELRFNLPTLPIDTSNLAANKVAQDSAGSLPARLVGLVDGKTAAEVTLPNEKDAWVEVDLGRDRPIAELNLVMRSLAFWQRFDVVTYATGQTPSEAQPWARELDWRWSAQNRRDIEEPGVATVHYRGQAKLARYVRLICREAGPEAKLAEIRVLAARPAEESKKDPE